MSSAPWLRSAKVQRVVYPLIVGLIVIAGWQALVVGFDLPPYLVPSPLMMMKTLIADWPALGSALMVTVRITLLAFAAATVLGVLISFLFVQSKAIETTLKSKHPRRLPRQIA